MHDGTDWEEMMVICWDSLQTGLLMIPNSDKTKSNIMMQMK